MRQAKHVLIVMCGKGGMGKTPVAVNVVAALARASRVGLLDAELHGPSVSKMLGIEGATMPVDNGKLVLKMRRPSPHCPSSITSLLRLTTLLRDGQPQAVLVSQPVRELAVMRNSLNLIASRVEPQGIGTALSLKTAAGLSQTLQEDSAFHSSVTVSHSASAGTPRSASSRRSSRISAIAPARLRRASSFVCPCPLAPGISGQ